MRHWDLNPQALKYESSPITTRPGLPPNTLRCLSQQRRKTSMNSFFGAEWKSVDLSTHLWVVHPLSLSLSLSLFRSLPQCAFQTHSLTLSLFSCFSTEPPSNRSLFILIVLSFFSPQASQEMNSMLIKYSERWRQKLLRLLLLTKNLKTTTGTQLRHIFTLKGLCVRGWYNTYLLFDYLHRHYFR